MNIVLCGSLSFAREMAEIQVSLIELGHNCYVPEGITTYIDNIEANKDDHSHRIENNLIRKHYEKIKSADAILVVNITKNGIENYIGPSAFLEIGFAHILYKKIFILNLLPLLNYSDEITVMGAIVIDGHLSLIR
jgi:hypothetical protein